MHVSINRQILLEYMSLYVLAKEKYFFYTKPTDNIMYVRIFILQGSLK